MPLLAAAAWGGALLVLLAPGWLQVVAATALAALLVRARLRRGDVRVLGCCVLVACGVAAGLALREHAVATSPVAALAEESAVVRAQLTVTTDPVLKTGRFADFVIFTGRVEQVSGRGRAQANRVSVLVIAPAGWADVPLGGRLAVLGRLRVADDAHLAGVLSVRGVPQVQAAPGLSWRAAGLVRRSIRDAAQAGPRAGRALVPALVDGDDAQLAETIRADFRTTGLTHLLAVSGTNLTLVVGFVLGLARWCGVRGRWQVVVGTAGIAAFVLIARTEPSVLRAAAMGAVGLIALGSNGRERGSRALGVAVVALLLLDPWLATSLGFVLSVLATAGILFLAPGWRDALTTWLPRPVAEAVAVPAAAQLACTPVVAAISGQVSLVAVAANLLAAPAVGPTTILGLVGGVVGLVLPWPGRLLGGTASWCAAWIIEVAERGAALPVAAFGWGTSAGALVVLSIGCVLLAGVLPVLLRRRSTGLSAVVLLGLAILVPLPTPGWPPAGWVFVACDVGQGDALVLNAGPHSAVVVDAGPDPDLVDRCLHRLGIDRVPLVVLTHFHADHVDGLSGVLSGRTVEEIEVTSYAEPITSVHQVLSESEGRATVRVPSYGETRAWGDLTLQVLGPVPQPPGRQRSDRSTDGDGSGPNNASLVLLVETRGLRLLLAGDVEPEAQHALATAWAGLEVDVLKVPHHGSRHQDLPWLLSLSARLAVVSVGADNGYGHPSDETLEPLSQAGMQLGRTDLDGDLAVVVDDGGPRLVTRG
jgi:competence protein ComEC